MPDSISILLDNPVVRRGLMQAWLDSRPGLSGGREQGGFIWQEATGDIRIELWPVGLQDAITVPNHPGGQFQGASIIATFHTHPNTGSDYLQEPSETDRRAVRSDRDLRPPSYLGEFVVAAESIYHIAPSGVVNTVMA